MRNKISYIITALLLTIGSAYTQAETPYFQAQPETLPMQNAQVKSTTGYSGTVYAPFDASAPSEQSAVGENSSSKPKGNVRRGKITGPDTPPANEYPIGEPWVLAIFAIAFAGVVALRKRKNTTL